MSKPITRICFILDRSGSMKHIKEAIIKGFNKQANAIRKDAEINNGAVETYISLYTFNHNVEPRYSDMSVNFLEDLTEATYEIGGDTAMYDAVGTAIEDLKRTSDPKNEDVSYIVIIVSDGAERCSKTYTGEQVAAKIQECQDTKRWTFTYIGANQDLSQVAKKLNIPLGNVANYSADLKNTAVAMEGTTANLRKFLRARASGQTASMSFHSDGKKGITDYSKMKMSDVKEDMEKVPDNSRVKAVWRTSNKIKDK